MGCLDTHWGSPIPLHLSLLVGNISTGTKIAIELLTRLPATGPDLTTTGIETVGVKAPASHNLLNVLFDVISAWEIAVSHHKSRRHSELLGAGITLMAKQGIYLVAISCIERMGLIGLITHWGIHAGEPESRPDCQSDKKQKPV